MRNILRRKRENLNTPSTLKEVLLYINLNIILYFTELKNTQIMEALNKVCKVT